MMFEYNNNNINNPYLISYLLRLLIHIFPFFIGYISGDCNVVEYLIKNGANVNLKCNEYYPPLYAAIKYGMFLLIMTLMIYSANLAI